MALGSTVSNFSIGCEKTTLWPINHAQLPIHQPKQNLTGQTNQALRQQQTMELERLRSASLTWDVSKKSCIWPGCFKHVAYSSLLGTVPYGSIRFLFDHCLFRIISRSKLRNQPSNTQRYTRSLRDFFPAIQAALRWDLPGNSKKMPQRQHRRLTDLKGKMDHLMIRRNSQFGYVKCNYKDIYIGLFAYIWWLHDLGIYLYYIYTHYAHVDMISFVRYSQPCPELTLQRAKVTAMCSAKKGVFKWQAKLHTFQEGTKSFWIVGVSVAIYRYVVLHAKINVGCCSH